MAQTGTLCIDERSGCCRFIDYEREHLPGELVSKHVDDLGYRYTEVCRVPAEPPNRLRMYRQSYDRLSHVSSAGLYRGCSV